MSEPRIIKRYANRKLYDTQYSHYVTLDQIAQMIRSGEDVQIIDNTSKEDLTAVTLAQIIFEEEKKQRFMPLSTLKHMVQTGGQSIQHFASQTGGKVQQLASQTGGKVQQLASQTGEKVLSVFRRDKDGHEVIEPAPTSLTTEADHHTHFLKDFLEKSQHAFDEWQKKMDGRIRHAVETVNPMASLERELRTLSERIADLEKRIDPDDK